MVSMEVLMDKRIWDYIHAVDPVKGRKRLFAFAADKAPKLHMTRDVGILIMPEEGAIKHVFLDYLLLTQHIGHGLMGEIY